MMIIFKAILVMQNNLLYTLVLEFVKVRSPIISSPSSLSSSTSIGSSTSPTIVRINSSDKIGSVAETVSSKLANSSGETSSGYSSTPRDFDFSRSRLNSMNGTSCALIWSWGKCEIYRNAFHCFFSYVLPTNGKHFHGI